MTEPLVIAKSGDTELALLPALANRHGCITGATVTGVRCLERCCGACSAH